MILIGWPRTKYAKREYHFTRDKDDQLPVKAMKIRRLHEYYNHPSVNEMKRMSGKWFGDLEVTTHDIDIWHQKEGKFCSGYVEGKLNEHARRASTNTKYEALNCDKTWGGWIRGPNVYRGAQRSAR